MAKFVRPGLGGAVTIIAAALGGGLLALTAAGVSHALWFAAAGLAGLVMALLALRSMRWRFLRNIWEGNQVPLPKGPKIVVIGGGTGLATILRGLKSTTDNLTAIVTVADDGGSSGRLRQELGILPPGDIRNCLIAMADIEPLMESLMQYRFEGGHGLAGHSFGNLFLAAMTSVTGDFELAIKESSKILAVRGRVLPATPESVTLLAEMADGSVVRGESNLRAKGVGVKRIHLEPADCQPVSEALAAIAEADLIVIGPGSLYTSIIPNLLVKEIAEALRKAPALRVYICNAMTEPGETTGFSAGDHLQALHDHAGSNLVDLVLVNTELVPPDLIEAYAKQGAAPVRFDPERLTALGAAPLAESLITKTKLVRHDAAKLSRILMSLISVRKLSAGPDARWRRRFKRVMRDLVSELESRKQVLSSEDQPR